MKKRMKCLVALMLAIITVTMCAVPASATWTYPDGGTLTDYIVNTDDYNRNIYGLYCCGYYCNLQNRKTAFTFKNIVTRRYIIH